MLPLWFGSPSKSRPLDLRHAVSAIALIIAASFNSDPAFAQISTDPLPIGVIDHVLGKWLRAQDGQPLFRGDLLYEGDTVTIGRDIKKGKLVVVFFAGGRSWEKICSDAVPCSGTHRPTPPAGPREDFWSFLSSYFKSGRKPPSALTFGRSAIARGPRHALITTAGTLADFWPALEDVPPGSYELRLNPAPEGSLEESGSAQVLSIMLHDKGPLHVQALPHGLYLLTVNDASGQAIGSNVLILLCGSETVQASKIWIEAQKTIDAWPRMDSATRTMLLGQVLYAIDAECR